MELIAKVGAVAMGAVACGSSAGEPVRIGERAPEIVLEHMLHTPDGKVVTLGSLRGRVVVLDFWQSWCATCLAAFPHLNEMIDEFDSSEVVFIGLTDDPLEEAKATLSKHSLNAWVGIDSDHSVFEEYSVWHVPHAIVIDRDGIVVANTHTNLLSKAAIEDVIAGRRPDLLTLDEIMGGATPGDGGGASRASQPEATALDAMAQTRLQETAPGTKQANLARLAGVWSVERMVRAGSSEMRESGVVTNRMIQGGRVLHMDSPLGGGSQIRTHAYLGYDQEKEEFYMVQLVASETAPVLWRGTFDAAEATITFTRKAMVEMGSGAGREATFYRRFVLDGTEGYTLTTSIEVEGMGERVVSRRVARRG